ncbi:hypothetical protein ACFRMN_05865 [Streptomyces sp. NPDC056835]|uniref:hypothetical protein n=1 Tax=Streptomyces sp. NPDC056835 TaxID=3345956 RepID=UPI00368ABEEC
MFDPPELSRRRLLGATSVIGLTGVFGAGTTGTAPAADGNSVVPINWPTLGSYSGADAAGARVTAVLAGSARYLIGPWYAANYTHYLPDGYIDLKGTDERAVRLPAMAAVAATTACWTRRNIELPLAAAARPADLTSSESINGIQLSSWLQGTNIADDGTLENTGDRLRWT